MISIPKSNARKAQAEKLVTEAVKEVAETCDPDAMRAINRGLQNWKDKQK